MWYYDEHCLRRQNICTCKFHAFIASTDSRPITLIARISTWRKICTDILDQAMHHNQEPESVCQSRRKASLIFHSNMRRMLAICCMHGRLWLPRVRTQYVTACRNSGDIRQNIPGLHFELTILNCYHSKVHALEEPECLWKPVSCGKIMMNQSYKWSHDNDLIA